MFFGFFSQLPPFPTTANMQRDKVSFTNFSVMMQCYLLRRNMPTFKRHIWPSLGCFTFNWEHSTGKKSKSKKSTAVKDHMLFCNHIVSIDDFKILDNQ